ncbi:MAG: hypothetical protein GY799_20645 [Desulfobulbaceae bacterium]|nr:hypothetical protein [Desulfobulbaceae bacterium]
MRGDFSKLRFNPWENFTGVMHQQGRVLLDQDWNATSQIIRHQRQMLGRDSIGPHVAAVPAELRDSFKVSQAVADGTTVNITLEPGRVWLDGRMLQVDERPNQLEAEYLAPPMQTPQADPATIASGVRDAVILEVWEEAFNGFQDPLNLIEPALGGVDTTERVKLFHQLRLLRLGADDECGNLTDRLTDDFASKGKLTVSPADTLLISGECPVELGGGYTGFEHYMYRIEITDPDAGANSRFKWSRFDGGLVGRGTYDSLASEISITANDQMINHCGLTGFYLEALREGPDGGPWQIAFTADATLTSDGVLSLTNINGTWPGTPNEAFLRLWDGVDLISNYPTGLPTDNELENGILLAFEAPTANNSNYTPGDYWTLPVRAKGLDQELPPWPTNAPPQGVRKHRAPLAILKWNAPPTVTISGPDDIFDCRHVFQPLSQLDGCCKYTVGDGMVSHGDFESIQEALNNLPDAGGEICLLPGKYYENIVIDGKHDITIKGCGEQSEIIADQATASSTVPVIGILGSQAITITSVKVNASLGQIGILVDDDALGAESQDVKLTALAVNGAILSGIEVRFCRGFELSKSRVVMQDESGPWPGVFVTCTSGLIERNTITIEDYGAVDAETQEIIPIAAGRGGLQLGGMSQKVRVVNNLIQGGIGNGITLGSLVEKDEDGNIIFGILAWVVNAYDPCDPCAPGSNYADPPEVDEDGPQYQSAGALSDVRIERNRILDMGLNGIGVVAFFNLEEEDELISVDGLDVLGNTIRYCLYRELDQIPDEMKNSMGYGGISLADVDNLVAHDNQIEENGPDHLQPICGIFILHGEGVDISRNRIVNNGAKTENSANDARQGPRGGIYIVFGTAPKIAVQILKGWYPRQNGVPAVKVHDNIVSQPLGRALSITALGPVSVVGNQFTSQGMVFNVAAPSFFASTVAILNLGISNELYLQHLLFSGETLHEVPLTAAAFEDEEYLVAPRKGLDDLHLFSYVGNGNVLFNDNQVLLDLIDTTGFKLSAASVVIISLDDVCLEDNQCDASFDFVLDDFVLSNAVVIGWTLRVTGNRFKEAIGGALFSALTLSLLANTTVLNQGTHCIRAFNLFGPANLEKSPNTIIFDIFGLCSQDDDMKYLFESENAQLAQANEQPQQVLVLLK